MLLCKNFTFVATGRRVYQK